MLYQKYRDRAAFLFVYIQEAHPADGWQMESNKTEGVIFNQPKEWGERQSVAQACCGKLTLSIPCVVDTIDNTVDNLYAAWPERMFVINREGKIASAGKQGPWGFKPKETERALRQLLRAHHRKSVADNTQIDWIREADSNIPPPPRGKTALIGLVPDQ